MNKVYEIKLFIGCWGTDCRPPARLPATPTHTINEWENLIVFLRQSLLHGSLEQHQTTAPASSPQLMQIPGLSLDITFIQSPALLDCFPSAQCRSVFFCWCVSAGFHSVYLECMCIPFHSADFLQFCPKHWCLFFSPFVFQLFCSAFSIFEEYCFVFYPMFTYSVYFFF